MDVEKCKTFAKIQVSTESLKEILVPAVWHLQLSTGEFLITQANFFYISQYYNRAFF